MTKITAAVRATIRQIVADSSAYDADTVVISRTGDVSALKEADKTYAGHDPVRYLVGNVSDMVTTDGQRREGY